MTPNSTDASLVVGISSNVLDTPLQSGGLDGIGVYTAALERALPSVGVTPRRVGAPVWSNRRVRFTAGASLAMRVPLPASIAWSRISGLPTLLSLDLERAIDVYHATDYRIPKLRRTPVVATLYDAIPLERPEWASPRLRRVKNWLLRGAAANADRIIAISEATVEEIVRHYRVSRDRVRVVHLGVGDEWFEEPPGEAREAARRIAGVPPGYFLFVGTLQPRKNVGMLVQAYDRLDQAVKVQHPLVIVGKYGWGVEALRRELEARRADGRVLWLQYVERDVLRALYRDAAAFVFPSLAEGFGLPVLEAFAAGLPVVASDLPVLREVAGNHATLVLPDDVDALAGAMTQALRADCNEAANHARRDFARTFDWHTCAALTRDVYRELV